MKAKRQSDDIRTVGEIMTPDPLSCHPGDRLLDAAARMQKYRVRHLPVINGDTEVIGMLSDRDVRNAIGDPSSWLEHPSIRLEELRVQGAMSEPAATITADELMTAAIRQLVDLEVGALPVVDDAHHLIGIVSYIDILRSLRPGEADEVAPDKGQPAHH